MEASLKLGRIRGIPIGLHPSWFLIFGLLTWSLAAGYFPAEYPELPSVAHWLLGAVTSVLFFGSVLIHELGHSIIALRNQIPVRSITLFLFGGIAQIGREPRTPGAEFRIAIAGPLASLGLAATFGVLWQIDQGVAFLAAPSLWLARINLILAVFNMIPGFPLDGGRVLRAIIWKISGSFQQATQIASFTGQLVAFGFIGWGILTIFTGGLFNGLWLVFIGWFLQNAAASSYAQLNLREMLRGVTVAQVMQPECPQVPRHTLLQQLVDDHILTGGQRCFFVIHQGRLSGVLTLRDVSKISRANWAGVTVGEVMRPWDQLVYIRPDTQLLDALQTMDEANVAQMPVMAANELIGMLSREQVLHYLRVRSELGM